MPNNAVLAILGRFEELRKFGIVLNLNHVVVQGKVGIGRKVSYHENLQFDGIQSNDGQSDVSCRVSVLRFEIFQYTQSCQRHLPSQWNHQEAAP